MTYPVAYRRQARALGAGRLSRGSQGSAKPKPVAPTPPKPWTPKPWQPPGPGDNDNNRPVRRRPIVPGVPRGQFPFWKYGLGRIVPFPLGNQQWDAGNWQLLCGILGPIPPHSIQKFLSTGGGSTSCGLLNQAFGSQFVHDTFQAAATYQILRPRVSLLYMRPDNGRYQIAASWQRPGVGVDPNIIPKRKYIPIEVPTPIAPPWSPPIQGPVVRPRPRPWGRPELPPPPVEEIHPRGNDLPGNRTNPPPWVNPWNPPKPWSPPIAPPRPGRKPPPPRNKERKIRSSEALLKLLLIAAMWYDDILFGIDILKAFHDALPAELRAAGKKPLPQDMANALYKNWAKVDINTAIENVLSAVMWEKLGGQVEKWRSIIAKHLGDMKQKIRIYSFDLN